MNIAEEKQKEEQKEEHMEKTSIKILEFITEAYKTGDPNQYLTQDQIVFKLIDYKKSFKNKHSYKYKSVQPYVSRELNTLMDKEIIALDSNRYRCHPRLSVRKVGFGDPAAHGRWCPLQWPSRSSRAPRRRFSRRWAGSRRVPARWRGSPPGPPP